MLKFILILTKSSTRLARISEQIIRIYLKLRS
jgi:hypothetical protein